MAERLLHKVKLFIRIRHSKLDEDVLSDIDACIADLKVHGVIYADFYTDPLIFNAIKLYCKSLYSDDASKRTEFNERYKELRNCLKIAEGYGREVSDE